MSLVDRALRHDATVYAACAVTLVLGLFFVFVWAPHPWGWEGFDHYHQLALALASGEPFPTMDVPWGYAYFAAAWYRLFGDRPWIVLLVQVVLNAGIPWLTYRFALTWTDRTTAIVAAVLTGLFSFNTVYASTQSSDSVCTVIFMTAVVVFTRALRREQWTYYATVGALTGIAPQFRPNLILIPPLLAGYAILNAPTRRRALHAAILLVCAAAAIGPWVVRNYRLTHQILPTSVHGGVQLWYGSLQVGPYLHSRAYNPRSVFEASVFEYTSLDAVPIIVEAAANCTEETLADIRLTYWSDEDATRRRLAPTRRDGGRYTFEIPAPHRDVVIYYYFETDWTGASGGVVRTTPPDGARAPLVYFVSGDHLGDLDVHRDLLDVFDVARLMRHAAWNEPVPFGDNLRAAGVGNAREAVALLMTSLFGDDAMNVVSSSGADQVTAWMTFSDGSTLSVPRMWRGRITDFTITEGIASTLMTSRVRLRPLDGAAPSRLSGVEACMQVRDVIVNQVFYRREPHMMRRYSALAFDNIRRQPLDFALASAYRMMRLFIVQGTSDPLTTQQFTQSRRIYSVAAAVSIVFLALFGLGVVAGWSRGREPLLALLLIAYIPATLAPVLTNMRYTVTVQPLMMVFIAAGLMMLTGHRRSRSRPT
jgi:hypothetical protein